MIQHFPKHIVIHELVDLTQATEGAPYKLMIRLQEGGSVEHAPFPGDVRGLVAAMDICTQVMAGKFWLRRFVDAGPAWTAPLAVQIEAKSK